MKSGGWAYFDSVQESLEATCLAELALAPERQASSGAAILFLLKSQLSDGGWVFRSMRIDIPLDLNRDSGRMGIGIPLA
jgi:hypothetical protein